MKKKLLALMMVFAMLMSVTPMASASVWEDMAGVMADTEVKNALDTAIELVEAHKDEIYAEAYGYAEAEGYIADAQAALEDLSAALETIEVEGLEEAVDELQEDIAAIVAFLDEAETLEAFTDEIWDLVDEFVDDKAVLEELLTESGEAGWDALEEAYAAIVPCVEEIYTVAYEMMEEAYDDVVEAIAALAAEYGPAAEEFVREWLYENPKAVMETILAYGEDIDALLNHWNYHLQMILGPAWNAYGDDLVAAIEELLAVLENETAALTEEAAAALVEYVASLDLDGQIENIADAVKDGSIAIGEEALAELTEIVAELETSIAAKVDAVVAALEELAASEEAAEAQAIIEKAIEDVLTMEDELMAELDCIDADIAALYEELMVAVEAAEGIGEMKISELVAAVMYAVENPEEADFSEAIAYAEELLGLACEALGIVGDAAKEIAGLTEDIAIAGEKIDAQLIALNGEMEITVGAVEAILTAAGADAEALLGEACAAVDAFVTTTVDTVITDAAALVAACELELTAAVNEFVAAVETALYKATHGDVTVDCVATYTAIGDEADVYTSDLAELLGVEVAALDAETDLVTIEFGGEELSAFVNGQIAGMIAETVKANEDLVNVLNSNAGAMILAELNKMGIDLEAEVADLAWENYLDETAIGVKDETLAGIAAVLMDHDAMMETYTLDVGAIISPIISAELGVEVIVDCIVVIPVAELVIAAVDNLLYAYVDTAAQCVAMIEGVQEMAPEAEVVILGLTDAAEELELKVGNIEIDLGEYEDAIGTFANVHYFAYALLNGENTTFVAEKDAEAIYAALNVTDLGHDWAAVVTDPTCTEDGYTTYTCSKCGETYTADETTAIDHAWSAWTDNGNGTHSRVCANDASHVETDDHDFTDGDCVCGAKKPAEDEPSGGGGGGSRKWHCPTCKSDTCHSKAFSDLDLDAWYHEYTDYVLCKGMMNGMGGDIFAPNGETSRAMLTTILYRMAGSPAVTGEMPFADVAAGQWYSDAILWAAQNDVVLGYVDGNFGPMDTITREQIAAMFFRFAELKGMDTSKAADLASYKDAATVGAWATDYVEWAVSVGLMKGRAADTLAPAAGTTRAETAALLERWCEEIAD